MFNEINEELENFENQSNIPRDLRLFVDFDSLNISYERNQMEIPIIKYKRKKILRGSTVDLGKRKSNSNNLF